jgi:hypothetical protein
MLDCHAGGYSLKTACRTLLPSKLADKVTCDVPTDSLLLAWQRKRRIHHATSPTRWSRRRLSLTCWVTWCVVVVAYLLLPDTMGLESDPCLISRSP